MGGGHLERERPRQARRRTALLVPLRECAAKSGLNPGPAASGLSVRRSRTCSTMGSARRIFSMTPQ